MIKFLIISITCLILLSFVLILIEDNGVRLFSFSFYKYGIIIYKKNIEIRSFNLIPEQKQVITKDEGVFAFFDDGKVLFRSNTGLWRFRTAMPVKGVAVIGDMNHLKIVGRLPVGPTILFGSFLVLGLTLSPLGTLGFAFALFSCGIFLAAYFIEKSRMKTMVKELKEIFD